MEAHNALLANEIEIEPMIDFVGGVATGGSFRASWFCCTLPFADLYAEIFKVHDHPDPWALLQDASSCEISQFSIDIPDQESSHDVELSKFESL